MSSGHSFAAIPMACLLAVGLLGIAPAANAESVGPSQKAGKIAGKNAVENKRRFRSVKIKLPVGPTSVYYDYPYYYSRGYYPTHIGGYVYYPYYYYRIYYPRHVGPGPLGRRRSHGN